MKGPLQSSFLQTHLSDATQQITTQFDCEGTNDEGEDRTGWRSYERTWTDEAGECIGMCHWSAPPPIEGEGRSDIKIFDKET